MIILFRLIFFTGLLHEIVMRWLILANRQLALQNVRQKRKLQEEAQEKEGENEEPIIKLEEEVLFDIPKINEQSKKNTASVDCYTSGRWYLVNLARYSTGFGYF